MGISLALAACVLTGAALGLVAALALSLDEGGLIRFGRPRQAVARDWNGILTPAMGKPEFLDTSCGAPLEFDVVMVAADESLDLQDIRGVLRPIRDGLDEVRLVATNSSTIELASNEGNSRWSGWTLRRFSHAKQVRFAVAPEDAPLLFNMRELYDLEVLLGSESFVKKGAVALSPNASSSARVLVASDAHVASRWDEIERDVERLFPHRTATDGAVRTSSYSADDLFSVETFKTSFVNPNKVLVRLVETANELYDSGQIDIVLLLGDLVDYKFPDSRAATPVQSARTEWALLTEILLGRYPGSQRLRVPLLTTSGNHDYRLYPYSLQAYGLRHCGVPDEFTEEYLRRSGAHRPGKYRLEDLDSIRINTGIDHSLDVYYCEYNPYDDYTVDIAGTGLLVLDSGPDAFCRAAEHIRSSRWRPFLIGMGHAMETPDANGLSDDQIDRLHDYVDRLGDGRAAIVLTHAPLINNGPDDPLEAAPGEEVRIDLHVDLQASGSVRDAIALEEQLGKSGLGISTLFQNQLPVLKSLASRTGASIVLSAHGHHNAEFTVDRANGQIRYADYTCFGSTLGSLTGSRVLLLQGNAMGHLERSYQEGSVPSYRILGLDSGDISRVTREPIRLERPFPHVRIAQSGAADIVDVTFRAPACSDASPDSYVSNLIFFGVGRDGHSLGDVPPQVKIDVEGFPKESLEIRVDRNIVAGGGTYALVGLPTARVRITGRPEGTRIAIAIETFERSSFGYRSLGLVWHHTSVK